MNPMKLNFNKIFREINKPRLMENMARLLEIEKGHTFDDYHKAAQFTAKLIKDVGIKNCEIINFPADGKTVYQDKRMPLAWNAAKGRLTIKKSPLKFSEPVIADYERHPFHLVEGSVSAPKEGLYVRIITEFQLFNGENPENCLVVTNPLTRHTEIFKKALDLGAIGFVSDFLAGRYDTPDGIQWVNACTEGDHWHVQSEDRPFICFSISPRTGDILRQAASAGEVTALVECDGQRFEGELPVVTAVIPGRQDKELWIFSHLYEPLSDDNSSGVVGSIEMARVIKKLVDSGDLPPLEFSLRLVFTMEMYGYAAFIEKLCSAEGHKAIGAINTDSMTTGDLRVFLAPPGTPFYGNYLMEKTADEYKGNTEPAIFEIINHGIYADDAIFSEPTVGIPTLWPLGRDKWWHNSAQDMSLILPSDFSRVVALIGSWAASVLTINKRSLPGVIAESSIYAKKHLVEESRQILKAFQTGELGHNAQSEISDRMFYRLKIESAQIADFCKISDIKMINSEIKKLSEETKHLISDLETKIKLIDAEAKNKKNKNCKWFDYAASVTPKRLTRGLPYDLVAIPKNERISLPERIIYGPLAIILANMDGKKNLQRLIRETEWETNTIFSSRLIKKHINAISYLSDYGYLKAEFKNSISKKDIIRSLKEIGIKTGDCLLVHSSLSNFGHVNGNANTIIDAIIASIGAKGTAFFPTFTESFIYLDGPIKGNRYRPYDASNPQLVWTGKVPQV
jgi:hypothetical protein